MEKKRKRTVRKKVRALVMTGFGLNCENETAVAFEYCGAIADKVHLNDMLEKKGILDSYHIFAFIGGFSFGDHLGAGTVLANRLKHCFRQGFEKFIADGKLIIGICNGFQTMSRMGLVPALDGEYFKQQVALAHNDSGLFRDDWVHLKVNENSPCIFTKGIDIFKLPVRHGEGKFLTDEQTLAEIEKRNLVTLRYCDENGNTEAGFPHNPNGSLNNIAGICDNTGRIFGLMPHPEAYLSPFNAPDWQIKKITGRLPKDGEGVKIFLNAVEYARKNLL